MAAFIFLCDDTTEKECLDRRLFGTNPGEMHQFHYSKVAVGDTLFLYNLFTGRLHGPFTATTPCLQNIEPSAWKKTRRSFPWQVRVSDQHQAKVSMTADELRRHVPMTTTGLGILPPAELSDDQAGKLLSALRAKNE